MATLAEGDFSCLIVCHYQYLLFPLWVSQWWVFKRAQYPITSCAAWTSWESRQATASLSYSYNARWAIKFLNFSELQCSSLHLRIISPRVSYRYCFVMVIDDLHLAQAHRVTLLRDRLRSAAARRALFWPQRTKVTYGYGRARGHTSYGSADNRLDR